MLLGSSELDGTMPADGIVDITTADQYGVPDVLRPGSRGSTHLERLQSRLDRQLLTTWLNVMTGEIDLTDELWNGQTYLEVITEAEATRLDSTTSWEVRRATWRLGWLR